MAIGSSCVAYKIFLPVILVPLSILIAVCLYYYVEAKRKEADAVWRVKPEDLHFDSPPLIIGRGSFGLVLLAEYRGTKVAVKRVLPPREQFKSEKK